MELTSVKENLLNNSLGSLTGFERISSGIRATTDHGNFQLMIYDEGLIRVRIAREAFDETPSYAVVEQPAVTEYSLEETDQEIRLRTELLELRVSKYPVRFAFYDLKGNIINQDDTAFGTSWIGDQVTTYKKLQKEEKFVGLGEKTGPLNRAGKGYQNWNTDRFAYGPEDDPIYCSIPFYIGIHSETQYGIFFDNSHKSHFNFGASNDRFSSFSADLGEMDYYFIHDKNVAGILDKYTWLTGRTHMPPLWSLGFQQCRYSYYPESEVYTLSKTFRDKDIPADTIVFDIHYMEEYKIFSWDKQRFPDPARMMKDLEKEGFKAVVIFDPGIKKEEGYAPYDEGIKEDVFIKFPDGEPYSGEVWPGWCHFPDFTHEKTREWWAKHMEMYVEQGISGFWNDMNEIATWGQYLPELMTLDFEGNPASMRRGRNVYGMQMARATYEGAKQHLGDKRPFNLTRAGYSGIQRYGAVWTGDNVASDEHMLTGIRLINSMGLSGISFSGYDVGGFAGNSSEYLFARWIQLGAFSPFFRAHSMINSRDSEPWSYGEEVEEISRNYIKLRYKLLKYIYSTLFQSYRNGLPISRSLAIDYTHDENIYSGEFQNQYMFGDAFLVAPVESYKNLLKTYFPAGKWYEFFTDAVYGEGMSIVESPIQQLPVFVKESSIIPITPDVGRNSADLGEVIEYHIYQGDKENEFVHFEDDGDSYDYQKEDGGWKRVINYSPTENCIRFSQVTGCHNPGYKSIRVYFHGFDKHVFKVNEEVIESRTTDYRFIQPISKFDPFEEGAGEHLKVTDLRYLEFEYNGSECSICW